MNSKLKEIFYFGHSYGYYQDDGGSCNPYDENTVEFYFHEIGYIEGLLDIGVTHLKKYESELIYLLENNKLEMNNEEYNLLKNLAALCLHS